MSELIQCYNRGCGEKYNPKENKDDSCRHHPGQPFFHDAYKGWSCCNKKCTDFTEFLNIKGCTLSPHSNIQPVEPEKPKVEEIVENEIIEVKPKVPSKLQRPSFDSTMVTLKPEIASSLKQQISNVQNVVDNIVDSSVINIGTKCKNGGCNVFYEGPETDSTKCIYHPGVPIFHEGLKFWSCCRKRTTDFNAFLNQVGCEVGNHVWKKEGGEKITCRWDYHQTSSHMIVSIYAKEYDVSKSVLKLNPVRLYADLTFQKGNFLLDLELQGIVDIGKSTSTMYGTKVEIKLKKAEPGSWSKLEIPRVIKDEKITEDQELVPQIEAVDLSDL